MKRVVWLEAIPQRPYVTGRPGDAKKSNYHAREKDEAGPLTEEEMKRAIAHMEPGQLQKSSGLKIDTFNNPQSHGSRLIQLRDLLEKDLKELDGLLNGLDKEMKEARVEGMNRNGMHPEVSDLIDEIKSGRPLGLRSGVILAIRTKKWNREWFIHTNKWNRQWAILTEKWDRQLAILLEKRGRQLAKPIDGSATKAEELAKPPRKGSQDDDQKERLQQPYFKLGT
ncbi:hypothetical protein MMC07_000645, partial [Pseudocyphellaria aurata]|nr:hypothetical protein [Pseudocyphellaria aurata]